MEFSKQPVALFVENFDFKKTSEKFSRHVELLTNSIRAVFCGPRSCGKTNALLAPLTHPNGLRFDNLYIYSKTLRQPKYEFSWKVIEFIESMRYFAFSEHDDVISPEASTAQLDHDIRRYCLWETRQCAVFFCMGRHNNVDSFYLNQSYARIPEHLIRKNINLLVLFKQD